VIVEDPSEQCGRELLRDITDPRLRHQVNPGRTSLVEQRNQALREARGEFLAILDADDLAEPNRLARQVAFLRGRPEVDLVGSGILVIDPEGRPCGCRRFPTDHAAIVRALRRIVPFCHSSVLARRTVLLRAGGYRASEPVAAEDFDLWCRLARQGARFANLPEPMTRYRIHPGQIKAVYLRETIRAVVALKRRYWSGQLDWGSWLRLQAERLLLWLPPALVLRVLLRWHYQDELPQLSDPEGPGLMPLQPTAVRRKVPVESV
jgi:glycosyltransferase involved in cell wall biosynthesis